MKLAYDLGTTSLGRPSGSAPVTLNTNLIAYWDMSEESGTRTDEVNGYTLTVGNGDPGYAEGINGNAAAMRSSGPAADLQHTTVASLGNLKTTGTTISFWMKWTGLTVNGTPLVKTNQSYNDMCYEMWNGLAIDIDGGDGTYTDIWQFNNSGYSINTWYHVVIGYDPEASVFMKINNVAKTAAVYGTPTVPHQSADPFLVGVGATGSLDELAIWDRVLSADEITELYNSGSGTFYPFS